MMEILRKGMGCSSSLRVALAYMIQMVILQSTQNTN